MNFVAASDVEKDVDSSCLLQSLKEKAEELVKDGEKILTLMVQEYTEREISEKLDIRKTICDTNSLETEKNRLFDEMSMLSEMTQTIIAENARVAINQDDYNKRFNDLSNKYDTAKQKYEQIQKQIQELDVRSQQLEQFQRQVSVLDTITEFDVALWGTLVDFITVNEKEKIVTFRDGTEITI